MFLSQLILFEGDGTVRTTSNRVNQNATPPPPQTINFQSDELNFGYISLKRFKEWRNSMKQKEHGDFTSIIIA